MIEAKRKTRMVSFRLTLDDYRSLRGACEANGVRSVSELARVALRNISVHPSAELSAPDQSSGTNDWGSQMPSALSHQPGSSQEEDAEWSRV